MSKAGTATANTSATRISDQPTPTLHPGRLSGAAATAMLGQAECVGTIYRTEAGFDHISVVTRQWYD